MANHGEHGVVDEALCTLPPAHEGKCNGFMRVSCSQAEAPVVITNTARAGEGECRHGTRKTLKCRQCVTDDIADLAGPFGRKMGGGIDVVGPQPPHADEVRVTAVERVRQSGIFHMSDLDPSRLNLDSQPNYEHMGPHAPDLGPTGPSGPCCTGAVGLVEDAALKAAAFRDKLDADSKRRADLDELQRRANNANTKDTKQSNPKDAVGVRKARWFSYLPLRVMLGIGLALLEGARKYGRHNYRVAGVRASVYVDAVVCGHLMPWMEGEDIDPDTMELDSEGKPIPGTGLNHIDKALASLIVLRDGMYEGNWVDDRPPAVKEWPAFIAEYHRRAAAIIDRYKDPKAPFTHEDTVWRK